MRGHVKKNKGTWFVVLELERDEEGKRKQKWISARKELGLNRPAKKAEADALLLKILSDANKTGYYIEPTAITVEEYMKDWLNEYGKANLRESTAETYEYHIKHHIIPEIGHLQLNKLRPYHIKKLYNDKVSGGRADGKDGGLSTSTLQCIHSIISKALKTAVADEILIRNAADAVAPPRQREDILKDENDKAWGLEEAVTFLEAVKEHRLYPLYLLAIYTGMRRGELLGIRWKDIDTQKGAVHIRQELIVTKKGIKIEEPKTKKSKRSIAISKEIIQVLKRRKTDQSEELLKVGRTAEAAKSDLVFTTSVGTPMGPRNLTRHFERTIAKINEDAKAKKENNKIKSIPFHGLRHTHATLMLELNISHKVTQERLGHSRFGTTMDIYTDVNVEMQRDAADRFEELFLHNDDNEEESKAEHS